MARDKKQWADYMRRYRYNLSVEEYERVIQSQACGICGKSQPEEGRRFHIDHDHDIQGKFAVSCATTVM